MWHVGIDLHRVTVVIAAVNDAGEVIKPVSVRCEDAAAIVKVVKVVKALGTFRAVIEAIATYRWLYDLLRPYGTILLAHPFHLRAMVQRRTKTDKLDAQLPANLLRIDQIPLAYIPPVGGGCVVGSGNMPTRQRRENVERPTISRTSTAVVGPQKGLVRRTSAQYS
jgi:transposase